MATRPLENDHHYLRIALCILLLYDYPGQNMQNNADALYSPQTFDMNGRHI